MALDIPNEEATSIKAIKALPNTSLERFISALKDAPLLSDPREMVLHVAKAVPSIPEDQLSRMIEVLYTLYHIRELAGVEHSQFLDDLTEGLLRKPELQLSRKTLSRLRSVLDKLMSIDSLKLIAKAYRLQRDGERLYCTAKILSDIRPVFTSDPSARPVGSVLTHTLKVEYHEGAEHREFHIVLDSSDLSALRDVVCRAQAKDKTLRNLLKSVDLPSLDE